MSWDRESLRSFLLDSADKLRNSFGWKFLNSDQKSASKNGRLLWSENTPVTDAALDRFVQLMNGNSFSKEETDLLEGYHDT